MTPAKGPGPTATMKIVPITRSGTERSRSSSRRTGCCSQGGATLRAPARPSGMAIDASPGPCPTAPSGSSATSGRRRAATGEVRPQELLAELAHVVGIGEQQRGSFAISTGPKLISQQRRSRAPQTSEVEQRARSAAASAARARARRGVVGHCAAGRRAGAALRGPRAGRRSSSTAFLAAAILAASPLQRAAAQFSRGLHLAHRSAGGCRRPA